MSARQERNPHQICTIQPASGCQDCRLGGELKCRFKWGEILFIWTLRKYTCAQCVNFSCPFNLVPHPLVTAYLQRNPAMQRAWKAAGWQVGGNQNV